MGDLVAFKALLIKEKMKDVVVGETGPSKDSWATLVRKTPILGCSFDFYS